MVDFRGIWLFGLAVNFAIMHSRLFAFVASFMMLATFCEHALVALSNETEGDIMARAWLPSKDRPLPVHMVFEFYESGNGGINNILWAIAQGLQRGCERQSSGG